MKKEQLGELIIASEETLYRVAKSLLYNDADCADAIQEAIVKAFSKLHTKEKRIISLDDYQMEDQASEQDDYSELYEAIFKLPEPVKLCVTLYYLEGYSVKEVAQILDVTESAVKNRLLKARAVLKESLIAN